MRKYILRFSLLMAFFYLVACSSEDVKEAPFQKEFVLNAEVSEFPNEGEVVADINSGLNGELVYTLRKLSKANTLDLNQDTGVLTVKDPSSFDFETTPFITGEVEVSNGTDMEIWSVEINIQDVDDISYWLTDSKDAYEMENTGNWVIITAEEYEKLATSLTSISKSGTTDVLFQQGTSVVNFFTYTNFTVANNLSTIPSESYVFALKYLSLSDDTTGNKVKVTTGEITDSYTDLGNPLPNHGSGIHFFVLKGAGKSTTSNRGFLGFYSQNGLSYDTDGEALGTHYAQQGNISIFGTEAIVVDGVCMYQGLSTTFKQWD